jgi:putative acetyltransferase
MKTNNLLPHIRAASREMVRQFGLLDNRFADIGSTSQCHALVELETRGVMNLGQLAGLLNLDKSTTSRLVSQLLEKGLCHLQADENDRRNKLIFLTEKGLAAANKISSAANLQVQKALDMLNDDEKNLVVQGLSIYAKALKRSRTHHEYVIRKLGKNDVPPLINLIKTIWAEFGFDSTHPDALLFEKELNQTYEIFTGDKSQYFVLMQDKKIVGGVGYAPLADVKNTCEVKGMYISAQLRGLGLGELLLQKVLDAVEQEGFKQYYIETMDYMHGANALYKRYGFKSLAKPMGNTGHGWTNCWYVKKPVK